MKSKNANLKNIAENTGSEIDKPCSNNAYLKEIAKNTGSEITGTHSDNFYLNKINENLGDGESALAECSQRVVELQADLLEANNAIDGYKNRIELLGNKSVIQSGDTAGFMAMAYENDEILKNETIYFYVKGD